jgi:acyl-CoA synthetase (AMP-forming)/AMP-acid ligase II
VKRGAVLADAGTDSIGTKKRGFLYFFFFRTCHFAVSKLFLLTNFVFRDRIKDLLKVDNHWFGPGEVEDTLEELSGTYSTEISRMKVRQMY